MSKKIVIKPKPKSIIPKDVEAKIDAWVSSSHGIIDEKNNSSTIDQKSQQQKTNPLYEPEEKKETKVVIVKTEKLIIKRKVKKDKNEEEVVRINFNIPLEKHKLLKVFCARAGVSIKDFCIQLLDDVANLQQAPTFLENKKSKNEDKNPPQNPEI